jgi:ABC-type multidrug transport system fused ATPase/permease subunit
VSHIVPRALRSPKVLSIAGLLRPHWIPMTLALLGVAGEAAASLLEPWPLKVVLDYLLQSRPLPGWMTPVAGLVGGGRLAVLNLAVVAVALIAVAGAISAYANTALTANVGQWVMHDLRRTLYHHIHRLSLAEHDEKRTGDLIGRVTSDIESIQSFITTALLGMVTNALTLVGIIGVMLSKATDTVSKASVGFDRIREVLETEGGVRDRRHAQRATAFRGAIEFSHVSFAYSPDQPILKDVSFSIEPGQVAAFVGPTGGGKTTIINLIARFYDPVSGTITIDGSDIRNFTIRSLRDQISFVLQDTLLFHAPIWQNIAYGRPDAKRADIVRAAELANADGFIMEMPEGYDTMIGERGVSLSGGQRQRIAIARATIRDTPILILDEPTSGLDAQSEHAVFEALDRLMKGKTSIVIAHHLGTVVDAGVIFVVKDNHLAERGTHEELLAAGGFYAELHRIQFGEHAVA